MDRAAFEWDTKKDAANQQKHGVSFALAQRAFLDEFRVIAVDEKHRAEEERYFCIGKVGEEVMTVRFTCRENVIRIYGAGFWRKGKRFYEKENKIRR